MKNLTTIIKKDLKGYFDQPTGYVLIVIFSAVSAYLFFFVSGFNDTSEASVRDLFTILPWLLAIFIPASTMRLIAEEQRDGTLEILLELNWARPSGRKNVPGKPIQYVTTDDFLSHFNLQKLSDLPNIEELTSTGLIDSSNVDSSIFGSGKYFKEQMDEKKENIYSNIDDMLKRSLKSNEE